MACRGVSCARYVVKVGDAACDVRAFAVTAIEELLGFEHEADGLMDADATPVLIGDVVDSRMIAPPRPRRRRDRSVSSRAMFYAGGDA